MYAAAVTLVSIAIVGLIHLHVRLAVVVNDVRWIRDTLSDNGLMPQPEWRKRRAQKVESA